MPKYVRDPKTGQWRNQGWQRAQNLQDVQGKRTGDFEAFSDYGAPTSADDMKKSAGEHQAPPGGRKDYGVDFGD